MKVVASPTTWAFVTMLPFVSKTIPEPSPSRGLDLDDRRRDLAVDADELGLELRGADGASAARLGARWRRSTDGSS